MRNVRIGTSGWHYKHWVGPFYPANLASSKMLEFYIQRFDTVEINNSFYRLPSEEAFREWRKNTPPGFCFAVKGSRFITHNKKLKDPEPSLELLLPRAEKLKEKLGPILFQLPPMWRLNVERLEGFLGALPRRHRYSFEFRNETWNTPAVYEILRKHNAAYCMFHLAGFQSPLEITADFAYIRLHGPGGKGQLQRRGGNGLSASEAGGGGWNRFTSISTTTRRHMRPTMHYGSKRYSDDR